MDTLKYDVSCPRELISSGRVSLVASNSPTRYDAIFPKGMPPDNLVTNNKLRVSTSFSGGNALLCSVSLAPGPRVFDQDGPLAIRNTPGFLNGEWNITVPLLKLDRRKLRSDLITVW